MKTLDAGHTYQLTNLDIQGNERPNQLLYFVKRAGPNYPGNFGQQPGTTTQEVLRALRERAQYVNRQTWCWQTWLSIPFFGLVIWLYELRAAKRHKRKAPGWREAIYGRMCPICGHAGHNCQKLDYFE